MKVFFTNLFFVFLFDHFQIDTVVSKYTTNFFQTFDKFSFLSSFLLINRIVCIFFVIAVSANRMRDNGLLGEYKIRERTKVTDETHPPSVYV